jgi:hypothetical protein
MMAGDFVKVGNFRGFALTQDRIVRAAVEQALIDDPGEGFDAGAAEVFLQVGGFMDRRGFRQCD